MKVKTNVRVGAYDCGQGGVYVVPSNNGIWGPMNSVQ